MAIDGDTSPVVVDVVALGDVAPDVVAPGDVAPDVVALIGTDVDGVVVTRLFAVVSCAELSLAAAGAAFDDEGVTCGSAVV